MLTMQHLPTRKHSSDVHTMSFSAKDIDSLVVRGHALAQQAQSLLQQADLLDQDGLGKVLARLPRHALERLEKWLEEADGQPAHPAVTVEPRLGIGIPATLLCKTRA